MYYLFVLPISLLLGLRYMWAKILAIIIINRKMFFTHCEIYLLHKYIFIQVHVNMTVFTIILPVACLGRLLIVSITSLQSSLRRLITFICGHPTTV